MAVEYIMLGIAADMAYRNNNPKIHWEKGQAYRDALGYNIERQTQLEGYIISDQDKLLRILGRDLDLSEYSGFKNYQTDRNVRLRALHDAIKEIASREGWRYYDTNELLSDPEYRRIIGMKHRPVTGRADKVLLSKNDLNHLRNKMNIMYTSQIVFCMIGILICVFAIMLLAAIGAWYHSFDIEKKWLIENIWAGILASSLFFGGISAFIVLLAHDGVINHLPAALENKVAKCITIVLIILIIVTIGVLFGIFLSR